MGVQIIRFDYFINNLYKEIKIYIMKSKNKTCIFDKAVTIEIIPVEFQEKAKENIANCSPLTFFPIDKIFEIVSDFLKSTNIENVSIYQYYHGDDWLGKSDLYSYCWNEEKKLSISFPEGWDKELYTIWIKINEKIIDKCSQQFLTNNKEKKEFYYIWVDNLGFSLSKGNKPYYDRFDYAYPEKNMQNEVINIQTSFDRPIVGLSEASFSSFDLLSILYKKLNSEHPIDIEFPLYKTREEIDFETRVSEDLRYNFKIICGNVSFAFQGLSQKAQETICEMILKHNIKLITEKNEKELNLIIEKKNRIFLKHPVSKDVIQVYTKYFNRKLHKHEMDIKIEQEFLSLFDLKLKESTIDGEYDILYGPHNFDVGSIKVQKDISGNSDLYGYRMYVNRSFLNCENFRLACRYPSNSCNFSFYVKNEEEDIKVEYEKGKKGLNNKISFTEICIASKKYGTYSFHLASNHSFSMAHRWDGYEEKILFDKDDYYQRKYEYCVKKLNTDEVFSLSFSTHSNSQELLNVSINHSKENGNQIISRKECIVNSTLVKAIKKQKRGIKFFKHTREMMNYFLSFKEDVIISLLGNSMFLDPNSEFALFVPDLFSKAEVSRKLKR